MLELRRTPLHCRHIALGATMVDFGGWHMPLMYPTGVVAEHLATRRKAGLFDVSHMGRFSLGGMGVLPFLQRVLSNNAGALEVGQAQYTFLPSSSGGAIDDAYLYRFSEDEYLLVVNAANRGKDWLHLQARLRNGPIRACDLTLEDRTEQLAMISLQGPKSREMVYASIESGTPPEPRRNELSVVVMAGARVLLARTGYTGEPLGFELFVPREQAPVVWDLLAQEGAVPCGLGARDTLRLEAALPLYGHELGLDPEGREIPIISSPQASLAVSFSSAKGDYLGREVLLRQQAAYRRILDRDYSLMADLPRMCRALAVVGRGVARAGSAVAREGRHVGWVTSGTMVPYWKMVGEELESHPGGEYELRPICLALLDSDIVEDDEVVVDVRGKNVSAFVVPYHLRADAPPYARPIVFPFPSLAPPTPVPDIPKEMGRLLT